MDHTGTVVASFHAGEAVARLCRQVVTSVLQPFSPSRGEAAFYTMQHFFGWAKQPILSRVGAHMDPAIPLTLIYGSQSWMRFVDSVRGEGVQECRPGSYVDVQWVEDAGHHVHADRPQAFNDIVSEVCSVVDSGQDLDEPVHKTSSR